MTFLKLQKVFKFLFASVLGTINLIAFLIIAKLTEQSVVCSAIANQAPDQLSKPIAINIAGIFDAGVNFITRIVQYSINFIVLCFQGHKFISIPPLDLPAANLTLPVSPIQIIPFFSDPSNVLTLCNYTNVVAGISSAVLITAILSSVTTAIVTSDLPKKFAKFINQRLAQKAVKLMNQLILVIEKIETDLLDDFDLIRAINQAKCIINKKEE